MAIPEKPQDELAALPLNDLLAEERMLADAIAANEQELNRLDQARTKAMQAQEPSGLDGQDKFADSCFDAMNRIMVDQTGLKRRLIDAQKIIAWRRQFPGDHPASLG